MTAEKKFLYYMCDEGWPSKGSSFSAHWMSSESAFQFCLPYLENDSIAKLSQAFIGVNLTAFTRE